MFLCQKANKKASLLRDSVYFTSAVRTWIAETIILFKMLIKNRISMSETKKLFHLFASPNYTKGSSSPRSISIAQLNTLLHLHPRPINLVVYERPYSFEMMGYLILRCTSRLDAFSVYYIRTRLPSYALGRTTDAPEVRPTRSSRTKVSSSQISNAHDR